MVFRCSPDVDNHFVAGAESIVLRSGKVLAGFKSQRARIKYFVPVDLTGRHFSVAAFVDLTADVIHCSGGNVV